MGNKYLFAQAKKDVGLATYQRNAFGYSFHQINNNFF